MDLAFASENVGDVGVVGDVGLISEIKTLGLLAPGNDVATSLLLIVLLFLSWSFHLPVGFFVYPTNASLPSLFSSYMKVETMSKTLFTRFYLIAFLISIDAFDKSALYRLRSLPFNLAQKILICHTARI